MFQKYIMSISEVLICTIRGTAINRKEKDATYIFFFNFMNFLIWLEIFQHIYL